MNQKKESEVVVVEVDLTKLDYDARADTNIALYICEKYHVRCLTLLSIYYYSVRDGIVVSFYDDFYRYAYEENKCQSLNFLDCAKKYAVERAVNSGWEKLLHVKTIHNEFFVLVRNR
jgi:hypothetical protein